jgi:UDP-glucuronate decarboxylase
MITESLAVYSMGMRILVTGGAGFLGSHLSEKLLGLGHEVICVDNFFTGTKRNIKHLLENKNFEVIRHDVTFPLFLEVDGIFNLACPASPVQYQKNPVQTLKTNVQGAINILGLAKRLRIRVLQASTSEIYGDPSVSPQPEAYWGNVNPTGIRSCYDEGKRAAETLFFDYQRQHGLDIRVARIFNTYGPKMATDDGRVVSNFIVQALQAIDLTVYGNGLQTRSLCFVDDLVQGLIDLYFTENIMGPVNLGNPDPVTMAKLAEEIISLTNSTSRVVFQALPADDPTQRVPDVTRARELINWTPKIDRREGLLRSIAYFKNELNL